MSQPDGKDAIRHAAMERLRFIDERLFWEARINRADLIAAFAISPAQAALDFRTYLAQAGHGVAYDTRAKCYVATDAFEPLFAQPDGRRKLAEFAGADDPLTATLPRLDRPLDVALAARVRRAARDRRRLLIDYQSFTRPEVSRRWIAPARLISDGDRWHARAWCYERSGWRDFVLARVVAVHEDAPTGGDIPPDEDWEHAVELRLTPAPHLPVAQRASVEREFAMTDGCLTIRLPRAMLVYARRRWGLDRPDARLHLERVSSLTDGQPAS